MTAGRGDWIDKPPEPDSTTLALRFGCGTIFGFFALAFFLIPGDSSTLIVLTVLSLLMGLAAMKMGDEFYRDVMRLIFGGWRS